MNLLNEDPIISVSALNLYIDSILKSDANLKHVQVRGEISNFKFHPTGHLYFSLKDETGVIRCVMFRSATMNLRFQPKDGMKIIAKGSIGVYSGSGSYQLYVQSMEEDGIGDLHVAFEKLKKKLYEEGLFVEEHKIQIPPYPKTIGIVTSPTGAAIQDMINILSRRYPLANIILYPALVQGKDAAPTIISGIKYFENHIVDVIIIGRGGGSIEDLWCFNDETLARTIYDCQIPLISAVGHEIDFTISDFVADLRAPTPSAAAELCTPNIIDIQVYLEKLEGRLRNLLLLKVKKEKEKLENIKTSFVFSTPESVFQPFYDKLTKLDDQIRHAYENQIDRKKATFQVLLEKTESMSPLKVLSRGYSVVSKDGKIVKEMKDLTIGDTLDLRLNQGKIQAKVERIEEIV